MKQFNHVKRGFKAMKQCNNVTIKKLRTAFTLIELIVVIAIIGVLTAFAVPNFMAARERARDIQRKNDLKQLQNAVEMYKLDNGEYPPSDLFTKMKVAANTCWYADDTIPGLDFSSICPLDKVIYMKKVVRDPNRSVAADNKSYFYSTNDVFKYTLCACLENKGDSDGTVGDCDASYTCSLGTGKNYTLTEP